MEIEVGEYVRFKNGKIRKVKKIKDEFLYFDNEVYWIDGIPVFEIENVFSDFISKHSKNIIDLIEVGDYVNGKKVERINDYKDFKRADFNLDYDDCDAVYNEDIKSIVTKEQFKSVEYEV